MSSLIQSFEREQLKNVPAFEPGDRVRVHFQVVEGTRRRTQVFEGIVLKRQGSGARETFTVRKQSFGVGVERTFPVHSPKIERVEVAARGDVRRAKLYYLRGRVGKRARVRERQYGGPRDDVLAGTAVDAEGVAQDDAPTEDLAPAEATEGGEPAPEAAVAPETSADAPEGEPEPETAPEPEPAPEAEPAPGPESAEEGDGAGAAETSQGGEQDPDRPQA